MEIINSYLQCRINVTNEDVGVNLLPRMFCLFVKDDVDRIDVTSCVESAVISVSYCICDESEGFFWAIRKLYLARKVRDLRGTVGYMRVGRMVVL